MKGKNIILILATMIIALAVVVVLIGKPVLHTNNKNLNSFIEIIGNSQPLEATVAFNQLVPFEWDKVYTFDPYTSKSKIEKTIGFSSNDIQETISEGMVQLIFVKDQKVVSSICGHSSNLGYTINFPASSKNYSQINYDDNCQFAVEKTNDIVKLTYIE